MHFFPSPVGVWIMSCITVRIHLVEKPSYKFGAWKPPSHLMQLVLGTRAFCDSRASGSLRSVSEWVFSSASSSHLWTHVVVCCNCRSCKRLLKPEAWERGDTCMNSILLVKLDEGDKEEYTFYTAYYQGNCIVHEQSVRDTNQNITAKKKQTTTKSEPDFGCSYRVCSSCCIMHSHHWK